jgi:hypothetical protein
MFLTDGFCSGSYVSTALYFEWITNIRIGIYRIIPIPRQNRNWVLTVDEESLGFRLCFVLEQDQNTQAVLWTGVQRLDEVRKLTVQTVIKN